MDVSKEAVKSKLKISDDVMITIARLAALDVKGVAGLGGEINTMSRLRKVSMMGDVAAIDIRIKVKSGEKARSVALDVQNAVKENIQNMTGVTVARVNVTISGVVFE